MSAPCRLCVFDLDGTLMNTIADLATACNYALSTLGYSMHPTSAYRDFVGNGIYVLFERSLRAAGAPEAEMASLVQQMVVPFKDYYGRHNADHSTPYEGIPELLQQLQERGIALAVASNKYQAATETIVHHFFPSIRFASILGQRDDVPKKPDPTIVFESMQAVGCSADQVRYIGDSDVDMQTAHNAGVFAIGVTWGFRTEAELKKEGANALVHLPLEILDFL